jgi:hypothetical protein
MMQHHRGGGATAKHIKAGNACLVRSHMLPQAKWKGLIGTPHRDGQSHSVITLDERWPDRDKAGAPMT